MGDAITPYKGRDAAEIIKQALELYDQGIEIEQSAEQLNVPARTIHRWLATNAPADWIAAQKGRAQADYEKVRKRRDEARASLEALEISADEINPGEARSMNWRLAHARECLAAADQELRHQEWLLERLIRKLYGQDAQAVGSAVQININLRREQATNAVQHEVIQADASKGEE